MLILILTVMITVFGAGVDSIAVSLFSNPQIQITVRRASLSMLERRYDYVSKQRYDYSVK